MLCCGEEEINGLENAVTAQNFVNYDKRWLLWQTQPGITARQGKRKLVIQHIVRLCFSALWCVHMYREIKGFAFSLVGNVGLFGTSSFGCP